MKQILLTGTSLFLCACNSATDKVNVSRNIESSTTTLVASIAPPTAKKANDSSKHDVKYYYKIYADIDSENPAIGVGPRVILEEDLKNGIISYKGNDNEIRIFKTWNLDGYDVIDFPGGMFIVQGDKEIVMAEGTPIMQLIKKNIDNRAARGGECDYRSDAKLEVIDDRIHIFLQCHDNASYRDDLGYISAVKDGELVIKEK
jgi:hypothetical protein